MISPRSSRLLPAALVLVLLAGCGSLVKVDTPPSHVSPPDAFAAAKANASASTDDIRVWWRTWNDPQMSELIERALEANTDIRTAQANLAAARALVTTAESALYPTVSAEAAGSAGKIDWQDEDAWRALAQPYTSGLPSTPTGSGYAVGVSAAWEADVFGRRRADVDAASAAAAVAEERLHGAQVLVAGEVAGNYRQALALRERLGILDRAIATAGELLRYTQARFNAGQATAAEVASAHARQEELKAARPTLETLLDVRRRRLAVLCGLPPQQAPALSTDPAAAPPAAPSGQLPSTVLERRPDVRGRQWAVQARTAQLKSLKADLLPSFGIVFLGGEGRLDFDGIPDATGTGGLLGLRISLPLFNAGRLRANVRAGDARLEAAVAEYDQIVLAALEEVENAYGMRAGLDARIEELDSSRSHTQRTADASQALFSAGRRTRDEVLKARLDLAQVDDVIAQARMQQSIASVRLYQALGGGW